MKLTHSLAQLQKEHVVLELECIDRMYLNAYVPKLTSEGGIAAFCRGYLGHRFASTKQAVAMTQAFVKSIETFIQREGLELVRFKKGQRKDAVLQPKLRRFKKQEGVIFVGVARVVSATMRARSRVARVVLLPDYGSKENRIVRPGLGDRAGTGATGPGGLAATAAAPRGYSRELVAADCTLGPVTRRESGGPSPPSQLHRAPAAHSGREGTGVGGQSLCRFRGGGAASVAGRGAVQH